MNGNTIRPVFYMPRVCISQKCSLDCCMKNDDAFFTKKAIDIIKGINICGRRGKRLKKIRKLFEYVSNHKEIVLRIPVSRHGGIFMNTIKEKIKEASTVLDCNEYSMKLFGVPVDKL